MPVITAAIDPVTRIEGHLKVEFKIDTVQGVPQVVDAFAVGTLFRGFEMILEGRDPRDATLITSRICGVCPTSHAMASVLALDTAYGVRGSSPERNNARVLRNLVHGACYLESHLLHFYLLSLPDYIPALPVPPWLPGWDTGQRIDAAAVTRLADHLRQSIRLRRLAHEMGAIFGGRLPHAPAYVMGGFTAVPSTDDKTTFGRMLDELLWFIEHAYLPDVELLAGLHPEYSALGVGHGHLLTLGGFELDNSEAPALFFQRGWRPASAENRQPVDLHEITEAVAHSWYDDQDGRRHPSNGVTRPQYPKDAAYSWLKAPRYQGLPAECGPLARMANNGLYSHGVSVMDRHRARALEALYLAQAMKHWLAEVEPGLSAWTPGTTPDASPTLSGFTEAPRGALGHWLRIVDGRIAHYQVVTPTCWNVSPRDETGRRGPLEEALIGVPVGNVDQPIEVLRVIHSFDPCLDCATHVMKADPARRIYAAS